MIVGICVGNGLMWWRYLGLVFRRDKGMPRRCCCQGRYSEFLWLRLGRILGIGVQLSTRIFELYNTTYQRDISKI